MSQQCCLQNLLVLIPSIGLYLLIDQKHMFPIKRISKWSEMPLGHWDCQYMLNCWTLTILWWFRTNNTDDIRWKTPIQNHRNRYPIKWKSYINHKVNSWSSFPKCSSNKYQHCKILWQCPFNPEDNTNDIPELVYKPTEIGTQLEVVQQKVNFLSRFPYHNVLQININIVKYYDGVHLMLQRIININVKTVMVVPVTVYTSS